MFRTALTAIACTIAMPAAAQDAEVGTAGPKDTRNSTYLQSAEGIDIETPDGRTIGEVEEVLIDAEGLPAGFLVEVGGFLDIGDREVAIPLNVLEWDGSHYVSTMTEEQLENLAPFDE